MCTMQSVSLSKCTPCSLSACHYGNHAVCRLVFVYTMRLPACQYVHNAVCRLSRCTPGSLSACLYVNRAVSRPVCMYTLQSPGLSVGIHHAVCRPCSPATLPDKIQFVGLSVLVGLTTYYLPPCYRPVFFSADRKDRSPIPLSDFRPLCIGLPVFPSVSLLSRPVLSPYLSASLLFRLKPACLQ
jgi:hypothetical protein